MTFPESLARLKDDKHVEQYARLCREDNPDLEQRDAYRALVIAKASGQPAPHAPSILTQLGTAAAAGVQAASSLARGESPFVQSAEQNAREAICRDCDRFDPRWNRCLECRCFLAVKTWLKAQSCPLGKW